MNTYTAVKNRILQLLGKKKMSIHKLAMESAVAPSSIKNILYGKSQNPGIVTIKMLCDGFGISVGRDKHDLKIVLRTHFFVELHQLRSKRPAGPAPVGGKVKRHHLAFQ